MRVDVYVFVTVLGLCLCDGTIAQEQDADLTTDALKHLAEKCPDVSLHRPLPFAGETSAAGLSIDLNDARIEDSDLQYLEQIRDLRDVSLWGASVTDAGMVHLARLEALESIDLRETRISDGAFQHLSALENLRLLVANETQITGKALAPLAKLPRLEWIQAADTNIRSLELVDGFPKLSSVDLFDCPLEEVRIVGLPSLSKLDVRSEGISRVHLEDLPELRELSINRCDEGRLEPRRHVALSLHNLPKLTSLGVYARIVATDFNSLDTMRQLTSLSVHGVDASGDFLARAAGLPSLKALGLGYMENVTNEHLASLARSQNLTFLDLGWGGGYDGEALQHFVGLAKLETLHFDSATPLTDEQAEHLSQMRNLRSLSLSSSCRLNGDALRHLAGLKKLRYLQIHGPYGNRPPIRGIRDDDLKYLAELARLEELDLMCNELMGPGLQHLVELDQLQVLNLSINPLTNEALQYLKKMRSLRTLTLERVALTPDCLEWLQDLTFLDTLWIPRGLFSAEQLSQLRKELNDTRVHEASFIAPAPEPPQ